MREYKILMNLIPEVEKLRKTIKNLTKEVEFKDLQLKEQRRLQQLEQTKCINVSHFSAVIISFDFSNISYTKFLANLISVAVYHCIYYTGTKRSNPLFGKWN